VHLGERSADDALNMLSEAGFVRDLAAEQGLRLTVLRDYLRESLFVLRRRGQPDALETDRARALASAGVAGASTAVLDVCNSEVMDIADPLVPQFGIIWVTWEACLQTLVQLRVFLFLVRNTATPGALPQVMPTGVAGLGQVARTLSIEWKWIVSSGIEALLDSRWDLGEMLGHCARLIGCARYCEPHGLQHATNSELEKSLAAVSRMDVAQGLCEGQRLGLWMQSHIGWVQRNTLESWTRPKPFRLLCEGRVVSKIYSSGTWEEACEGEVRFLYHQDIDPKSPWFPHRHQFMIEQTYFFRLAMA